MKVTVCRKAHFNATHRLHNPRWDKEKNERVFGKCNNPNYHGHNYNLTVKVTGTPDPDTGYVMDMKVLNDIIEENVCDVYDHKNLYEDIEDFKDLNPTAENIAIAIYRRLREKIDNNLELKIVLYETERNFVEYPGVG